MMAGLALAVSDLPELRNVVSTHHVGITFNPSDSLDIAHQINGLLDTPDVLSIMQNNALKAAQKVFNFETESLKLYQIVEAIIGLPKQEH